MKKNVIVALLLSFICTLTACTAEPKKQQITSKPIIQPTEKPIPTTTVQVPDSIQNNEIEAEQAEIKYIGNRNTRKFHCPDCSSLPAEKNRVELSKREEAVNMGFVPCKRCNP